MITARKLKTEKVFHLIFKVKMYCAVDGSSLGNPGPSGWGVVIEEDDDFVTLSGGASLATNSRMEIYALYQCILYLKPGCEVTILSDSMYVVNTVGKIPNTGWISKWKKNGWKKKGEIAHLDLWKSIYSCFETRHKESKIQLCWIKGHSGHVLNEWADRLAVRQSNLFKVEK